MMNYLKIGNVEIRKTAALAPMAGVGDVAYREICKQFGASYLVTEMVSAKALCYGDEKTKRLLSITNYQHPIAIQLFGYEPEYLAKAAYLCLEYHPDIIDINMGCPAKKITTNNSGSALLKEPKLVAEIAKSVVNSVNVPVTAKIRSGWDEDSINAVEIAKILEHQGISGITIHGRTRNQMYLPSCSLDVIKNVKSSVKIAVIGNGDIIDAQSAVNMYEKTGCDLVMIGRGALGNPWIFKEIENYMLDNLILKKPSMEERIQVIKKHVRLMIKYSSEQIAIKEARKHISWYLKGFKNAAKTRNQLFTITSFDDLDNILNNILKD